MHAAGRIVSRDELTAALYQRRATQFDRALDMHICNLRKKLGRHGDLIRTVRGVGYLFRSGPEVPRGHDMRTIFAKVLLWSLGTFALSLVAFWAISRTLERRGPPGGDPFHHVIDLVQDDACRPTKRGGPSGSRPISSEFDAYLPGEHVLTDARGRDLVSGADRSDLLKRGRSPPGVAPALQRLLHPRRSRRETADIGSSRSSNRGSSRRTSCPITGRSCWSSP